MHTCMQVPAEGSNCMGYPWAGVMVVSIPLWESGPKLWPSARAAPVLNHWALVPTKSFSKYPNQSQTAATHSLDLCAEGAVVTGDLSRSPTECSWDRCLPSCSGPLLYFCSHPSAIAATCGAWPLWGWMTLPQGSPKTIRKHRHWDL